MDVTPVRGTLVAGGACVDWSDAVYITGMVMVQRKVNFTLLSSVVLYHSLERPSRA